MDKKDFTILVDMDDTIENLLDAWVSWLNKKYSLMVKRKDITDWNIDIFFPSLTSTQVFDVLFEPGFWKTVKPKKDAIKYLQKLHDEGFNIILCTASHYSTVKEKFEDALLPYFSFFDSNHIIITNQKTLLKANVLIDDGIHNLKKGNYKKILYTTTVNQSYDAEKHGMIRVHNWKEIYSIVESMYEEAKNTSEKRYKNLRRNNG